MANVLFETGRNALINGTCNWATGKGASGGIQAMLVTPTVFTSAGVKSVTGITTATPPVVTTSASHGFTNGDVVVIGGVTTGNYNGIWAITAASAAVFTLQDPITGGNPVGNGTFAGANAWVLNLGPSASGATSNSFTNTYIGNSGTSGASATGQFLTGNTESGGIAEASTSTFTAVSGSQVAGVLLVACAASSGIPATTDIPLAWIDGQMIVTCAATIAAATSLYVERLPAAFANQTLNFSDGNNVAVTAGSTQFTRGPLTITSGSCTAGARASAPATGSGLPVTPNGGNIAITWDTVVLPGTGAQVHSGIFKV
jgi:hypothetical protein